MLKKIYSVGSFALQSCWMFTTDYKDVQFQSEFELEKYTLKWAMAILLHSKTPQTVIKGKIVAIIQLDE
jgi:hypothetical protein